LTTFDIHILQGGEGIRRKGYEKVKLFYMEIKNTSAGGKLRITDVSDEFKFWEIVTLHRLHVTGTSTEFYLRKANTSLIGTYFINRKAMGDASDGVQTEVDLSGVELYVMQGCDILASGASSSRWYVSFFEYDFHNLIDYVPVREKKGWWKHF